MISAVSSQLQRQMSVNSDLGTGFKNVKVDRDKLDAILSNHKSMLDYEDLLFSYKRSLNKEISKSRIQLLKKFE
jgi:hypothetical protein